MVTAVTQNGMKYGKFVSRELGVSKFIPYARHIDDHTISTQDGLLMQTLRVRGFAFETADTIDLNALKRVRATMLRALSNSRFALYHHIIRREVSAYPDGFFDNPFCQALDDRYRERLSGTRMFVNEQYLTLVRRPAPGAVGRMERIYRHISGKVDKELYSQRQDETLKALNDGVKKLQTTLQRYGVERLGLIEKDGGTYSEPLSFLGYLINQEMVPYRLPRMPLSEYLPRKRLSFGKETFEVRGAAPGDTKLGALMSVRDYATMTGAGVLDGLLRLPHNLTITQSFGFVNRQTALDKIKLVRAQVQSTEEGAVTIVDQLNDAVDQTTAGQTAFGEHHLTILGIGKDGTEVDQVVSDIDSELTNSGIVAVREDLNLEPGYWAQLPGNFKMIARKGLISTNNFSGFSSLHTFPSGTLHGNHWGTPITVLETTSGSPYWFSFHERDVGNFTLVGPTGFGKSVLLAFLCAQAQRVKPRLVVFDKDRGQEIFIRAIGGNYSVIEPGKPTGFNPLQLPDSPLNRAFLKDWLGVLASVDTGKRPSPAEARIIADAIDANYQQPAEHRRLSHLVELFKGFEVASETSLSTRFERWVGKGDQAWLFDNPTDTLSLENPSLGFDLTSIMDDPLSSGPFLKYAFHRCDALLDGTQKVMFMLEEAWKLVNHEIFAPMVQDWYKTIRKRGGLVGFLTQSPRDIVGSRIGSTVIEQSPTNIFLPNPRADEATYCGEFGLSRHELALIRELTPETRCFLIRHGSDTVIARLDLSGMDEFMAVLSGRASTVAEVDDLRALHGDNPDAWLPIFMERHRK